MVVQGRLRSGYQRVRGQRSGQWSLNNNYCGHCINFRAWASIPLSKDTFPPVSEFVMFPNFFQTVKNVPNFTFLQNNSDIHPLF